MAAQNRALSSRQGVCDRRALSCRVRCSGPVGELPQAGSPAHSRRQSEPHRAGRQNARWQARSVRDLGEPGILRQPRQGLEAGRAADAAVGGSPGRRKPAQPAQERSDGRVHAARRSPGRSGRQPGHAASDEDRADADAGGAPVRNLHEPDVPAGIPRRPSVPRGSAANLAGLFDRTLGRRHARRGEPPGSTVAPGSIPGRAIRRPMPRV